MSAIITSPSLASVNIGILGLGVVGSSTVNILKENYDELLRRTGYDIVIKKAAVRNLEKSRICSIEGITLTDNVYDVIQDPEIDIIIELIGGIELSKEYVLEAISQGKHIVTANKALIATHGDKIFSYAHDQNVIVAFEAAVAGGIPIIKILREGLVGNKIKSIVGILNGTGNFILTKMQNEGVAFINALGDAQRLGYAEADPTADIEGIDTAQKLSILSSIAFGTSLRYADVYIEGISHIKHIDLLCAKNLGYTIKHLAYAERNDINIELRVYPALIANTHALAKIDGVTNGVLINANAVGRTVYYGDGAGGLPTASAVIADLIDVIRTTAVHPKNRVPSLSFQPASLINYTVNSIEKAIFSYYLRFLITDPANAITTNINIIAAKYGIKLFESKNMSNLIDTDNLSTVVITDKTTERLMNLFILELQNNYNFTDDNIIKLRICDHGC